LTKSLHYFKCLPKLLFPFHWHFKTFLGILWRQYTYPKCWHLLIRQYSNKTQNNSTNNSFINKYSILFNLFFDCGTPVHHSFLTFNTFTGRNGRCY
jgi:hypothetical protein